MIGSPQGNCTAGLVVYGRNNKQPYLLTAGHCAAQDGSASWGTRFSDNSVHAIGNVSNYNWGPSDWAQIAVANPSGWHLSSSGTSYVWVGRSSGGTTTLNEEYPISQAASAIVGIEVCGSSGVPLSTGWHTECGEVTGTSLGPITETEPGGLSEVVKGLTETSACTGTPGASGGPLYKNNNAYGLLSAFFTSCDTLYQGMVSTINQTNTFIP